MIYNIQPLITIGITCYNAQHTLEAAIQSALNQNYSNYEILIVDDNSDDGSLNVISKFASNNIRVIKNNYNRGVAYCRNEIIHHSLGDIIVFFDDDDISYPNRLTNQLDVLLKAEQKVGNTRIACYASGVRKYPNGYIAHIEAIGSFGESPYHSFLADYLLYNKRYPQFYYGAGTPACSLMIRKSTLLSIDCFDNRFRRLEDADLAIRLAFSDGVIIGTKDELFCQYSTISHDKSAENEFENMQLLIMKYSNYLKSVNKYGYALSWSRINYLYFSKKYIQLLYRVIVFIVMYPRDGTRHFVNSSLKRLANEYRMK